MKRRDDERAGENPADGRRSMVAATLRALLGLDPSPPKQDEPERKAAAPQQPSEMCCERCGTQVVLIATLPATRQSPSVGVYQCQGCQIIDLICGA